MKNRMRFTACNWEVLRDNGSSLVAIRRDTLGTNVASAEQSPNPFARQTTA